MGLAAAAGAPADPAAAAADRRFMAAALALGRRGLGLTSPNPAVGALVVRDGPEGPAIVGRGWTREGGRPHAETVALADAGAAARGATLYVTLEPCSHHGRTPPCADAIVAAGIVRVVAAMEDPDPRVSGRGFARLRAGGVAVETGVGLAEARRTHLGHIVRTALGRPMVELKMALSRDGMIGLKGPRPASISSPEGYGRAHMMRAQADAIMVGATTVIADDPRLTCRLPGLEHRSPHRYVIDSTLRIPLESTLVSTAREVPVTVIAAGEAPPDRERALRAAGVEVLRVDAGRDGRLDLAAALQLLGTVGATRLMVEAGPSLASALLDAGLVDQAAILEAPVTIGAEGLPAFAEAPAARMARAGLRPFDRRAIGPDLLTLYGRD